MQSRLPTIANAPCARSALAASAKRSCSSDSCSASPIVVTSRHWRRARIGSRAAFQPSRAIVAGRRQLCIALGHRQVVGSQPLADLVGALREIRFGDRVTSPAEDAAEKTKALGMLEAGGGEALTQLEGPAPELFRSGGVPLPFSDLAFFL